MPSRSWAPSTRTLVTLRECLQSLTRLVAFRRAHADQATRAGLAGTIIATGRSQGDRPVRRRPARGNMEFTLNWTVGLIDIQQNGMIKIISVVAVVLTPPVLVASVYGMNFRHMPELQWTFGYAWAWP